MKNISIKKQGDDQTSPDQTRSLIEKLQNALNECPREPYTPSDPIPTDLLQWSAQKDLPSPHQNSFFTSSPHQTRSLIEELQNALNEYPRKPYTPSDPIPTDLLQWSAQKDLPSPHQNSFFTSSPHHSSGG